MAGSRWSEGGGLYRGGEEYDHGRQVCDWIRQNVRTTDSQKAEFNRFVLNRGIMRTMKRFERAWPSANKIWAWLTGQMSKLSSILSKRTKREFEAGTKYSDLMSFVNITVSKVGMLFLRRVVRSERWSLYGSSHARAPPSRQERTLHGLKFLGPNRDGVYSGPAISENWPKDGPPTLWSFNVGEGFAGPVLSQGKLIIFHRKGDKEIIDCLQSLSGKSLWSFSIPRLTGTISGLRKALAPPSHCGRLRLYDGSGRNSSLRRTGFGQRCVVGGHQRKVRRAKGIFRNGLFSAGGGQRCLLNMAVKTMRASLPSIK